MIRYLTTETKNALKKNIPYFIRPKTYNAEKIHKKAIKRRMIAIIPRNNGEELLIRLAKDANPYCVACYIPYSIYRRYIKSN